MKKAKKKTSVMHVLFESSDKPGVFNCRLHEYSNKEGHMKEYCGRASTCSVWQPKSRLRQWQL